MNRARINLILGVLFYPITDPGIQGMDYLYERYLAYKELISVKGTNADILEEKGTKNAKYRRTGEKLIQYLADSCRSRIRSYDDLLMLCELYYPLLEMDRSIEEIQRKIKEPQGNHSVAEENTSLFYLERIRRTAMSLLTYRDGILAIRTWNNGEDDLFCSPHVFDKVEIWNMLNSYISPDLLMALFIVECGLGEEALYGQKPYISLPDKLLVKVLRKGMAENHLHFNAGFDYEAVWLNMMNPWSCLRFRITENTIEPQDDSEAGAALFRLLTAVFFMEKSEKLFKLWAETLCGGIFAPVVKALYTGTAVWPDFILLLQAVLKQLGEEIVRSRQDYLLYTIWKSKLELKTSSEFIFLYQSCRYMREQPQDTGFARIFLQYIRIKNAFIRRTQQSSLIPGLRHFQKFFDRMKKAEVKSGGRQRLMLDVFRSQSKIAGLRKLEIRIAADVDLTQLYELDDQRSIEEIKLRLCRQLFDILYMYRRYILEDILGVQETEDLLNDEEKLRDRRGIYTRLTGKILASHSEKVKSLDVPVLGIIYHFIKSESADNISGYYCWRDMSRTKRSCSNHRFFLRERMVLLGIAIEQLRSEIPKLNEYIVGVDAASDENAMEPWMFSPAYLAMRSKKVTRPVGVERTANRNGYYNIQNMGFTYHVGEDYRHIVSGLRHIDEVIERFFYKPGDRLGHALALGLDIKRWIQDTEAVAMPVQEHMENLLWIWGKGIEGEIELPVPMERLEEKIMRCAEKIYHNISGITVRRLYQAYDKKFSSRHMEILRGLQEDEAYQKQDSSRETLSDRERQGIHTYCKMIGSDCRSYQGLWTEERLISALYCPVFEERGQQVEMVPVSENDLILYQKLQEYLLKKVAACGIYVETNPTSNLTIGNMKDLQEHPIFRLSPLKQEPGQERVMVMVNSDDPAVFNTNVENELAYVYYALEHAGVAKEEALKWIDKVRQNGIDGSFILKLKDCKTLLEEIGGILEILKKYC